MSGRCEVVVVGAGIVGAATARELAVRGVKTCLLDRGAVSGGSTGLGEGNVLCSDKDAGPELALTLLGLAVYDELDARLGAEARIRRKGALIVHPDAATWAAEPARVQRLRDAGVVCERLDAAAVRELEPQLTGPLQGATYVAADLQCDPRAIARALAREAAQAGADVREGVAVDEILVAGERVTGVRTAAGRVAAGAVVLAAGAWSAALASAAGLAAAGRAAQGPAAAPAPARARAALHPPQGGRRRLPRLGHQRGAGPARSPRCSRRPGTGTCWSAPAASGAASTWRSTPR